MSRTLERVRGRRSTAPFLQLPAAMIDDPKFGALSAAATKLLIDIARKYHGKNNGTLDAPYGELMRERYWRSRTSIGRALGELLRAGFLIRTRKGRRFGGTPEPSLYAITWRAIEASDLHSEQSNVAPNTWKDRNAGPRGGLVRSKQVHDVDLRGQNHEIERRSYAGFASPLSRVASPPGGPSFYNLSKGPGMRWPQTDEAIGKFCYFEVLLKTNASSHGKVAA